MNSGLWRLRMRLFQMRSWLRKTYLPPEHFEIGSGKKEKTTQLPGDHHLGALFQSAAEAPDPQSREIVRGGVRWIRKLPPARRASEVADGVSSLINMRPLKARVVLAAYSRAASNLSGSERTKLARAHVSALVGLELEDSVRGTLLALDASRELPRWPPTVPVTNSPHGLERIPASEEDCNRAEATGSFNV